MHDTPHPYFAPPPAAALLLELLGRCPECAAPLEYTRTGMCWISHATTCGWAIDVMRRAAA